MAITTVNGKLAVMEMDEDWEPGLPISPGALGQDDRQQLLWGFPEFLWSVGSAIEAFWCALTGMSGMTGGGDLANLGG